MSFTKYAEFEVIEARPALSRRSPLMKDAHRHVFDYQPRAGYIYVRSRAISSRCNDNFDEFPAEEIKKAYATFVGKPVFVNHHNADHRRARGVIIDAALHEDTNPDGSPDTWCEVLMEVDAQRFPILAREVLAGNVARTSMGTDVQYSVCTACGNRAESPIDYCQHIPRLKGMRIQRTTASGTKESVLVAERCYGLGFFENSLLVEDPADPTAFVLGVEAGMDKAAAREVIDEAETIVREAASEETASAPHLPRLAVPRHAEPYPTAPYLAEADHTASLLKQAWDQTDESKHPRRNDGEFRSKDSAPDAVSGPRTPSAPPATPPTPAKPSAGPSAAPAAPSAPAPTPAAEQAAKFYHWTSAGTKSDPIRTKSVDEAAAAILVGKWVDLKQPRQVSTLVNKLGKMVAQAKKAGVNQTINLCQVTVEGTNLFCVKNLGIPRIKMPQLGVTTADLPAGSPALKYTIPGTNFVNLGPAFRQMLVAKGVKVSDETRSPEVLKASQDQLNAGKVASLSDQLDTMAPEQLKAKGWDDSTFISRDDYIVDGHHRWAGRVTNDYEHGRTGGTMKCQVIDMPITDLLREANDFAHSFGIGGNDVSKTSAVSGLASCCGPEATFDPAMTRLAKTTASEVVAGKGSRDDHDMRILDGPTRQGYQYGKTLLSEPREVRQAIARDFAEQARNLPVGSPQRKTFEGALLAFMDAEMGREGMRAAPEGTALPRLAPPSPTTPGHGAPRQASPSRLQASAAMQIAPVVQKNLGRCYELACMRTCFGPDHQDFNGYTGATLVNGTIQGYDLPPLQHAFVIEPDGEHVWEPGTDTVYPMADFKRLYHPTFDKTYTVDQARKLVVKSGHTGPWDEDESVPHAAALNFEGVLMQSLKTGSRKQAGWVPSYGGEPEDETYDGGPIGEGKVQVIIGGDGDQVLGFMWWAMRYVDGDQHAQADGEETTVEAAKVRVEEFVNGGQRTLFGSRTAGMKAASGETAFPRHAPPCLTGPSRTEPRLAKPGHLQSTAYGETKAPSQVDTLRAENCPVCGDDESFDGNRCGICGYQQPPSQFRDPDLSKAREMDLRQDKAEQQDRAEDAGQDPTAPSQNPNADPDADAQGEDLQCTNCGEVFSAAGSDPQAGPPKAADPDDPAATEVPVDEDDDLQGGQEENPDDLSDLQDASDADLGLDPNQQDPDEDQQDPDAQDDDQEIGPDGKPKKKKRQSDFGKAAAFPPPKKKNPFAKDDDQDHPDDPTDPADPTDPHADPKGKRDPKADPNQADPADPTAGDPAVGEALITPDQDTEQKPTTLPTGSDPADPNDPVGELDLAPNMTCPVCGEGTLIPVAPQATGDEPDLNQVGQPDATKKPLSQTASAPSRGVSKEASRDMNQPNPAQARRNRIIAAIQEQQGEIVALRQAVATMAVAAGVAQHPKFAGIVRAAGLHTADSAQNPEGAPATTTEEAKKPQATDDVTSQGKAPGEVNKDVTPKAVTDVQDSNVAVNPPVLDNLADVTAPTNGTDKVDPKASDQGANRVTVSAPSNDSFDPPGSGGWKSSAKAEQERFVASMRLARLRIEAGLETGEDLALGQAIAASETPTNEITAQVTALSAVASKARTAQADPTTRHLVPRRAAGRAIAPAAGQPSMQAVASTTASDSDEWLIGSAE